MAVAWQKTGKPAVHCCECKLVQAQTGVANKIRKLSGYRTRTLQKEPFFLIFVLKCRDGGTRCFAYLGGDTERGGDTLRGGDLLPLRAGLLDLDADLEADLQLKHASCHTQDALTDIAHAQHIRG